MSNAVKLTASHIARAVEGTFLVEPASADEIISDLTWDSREVKQGFLYVALPGQNLDGHDFVKAAVQAGARGVLVMHRLDEALLEYVREQGVAVIEVADTFEAVTSLARVWRRHLTGRVIGLTGSTGKTTTKNLVRDVLSARYKVVATRANQNNELGVPRTILAADPDTEALVVEMGMRGQGQIATLCDFVCPDWALVTNIGESHKELLGSRENIARAKAEIFAALPSSVGVAFLNAADDFADFMCEISALAARGVKRVWFDGSGLRASSEYRTKAQEATDPFLWAEDIYLDEQGYSHFVLCARGFFDPLTGGAVSGIERCTCTLPLLGKHNVANACAAAALGRMFGLSLSCVADALATTRSERGRQEVIPTSRGVLVVNDAYNASPDSMQASLHAFCALEVSGRRIAVLGDMGELGDDAPLYHEKVGAVAATLPLDLLICVGDLAGYIAQGVAQAGVDSKRIVRCATVDEVVNELDGYMRSGDAVLVKASHFMGLTRVVEGLVN